MNQLYIPERIKVGFCERKDTYTGRLAYIIYFDGKGILRKQKSWDGWRKHDIPAVDHPNAPTEGFVLNKGVGGTRHSSGWNARNEYIRVYDPRDFEFEISVANLLFILRECDCSRGKGLEGKFIYAWHGTGLVLLPVNSQDYQQCKQYTQLQGGAVKAKELIPGATYTTKKEKDLVYLGRFDYHYAMEADRKTKSPARYHVFYGQTASWRTGSQFIYLNDLKSLATLKSDVVSPDYAALVDSYNKSAHGSPVVKLELREESSEYNLWWYEKEGIYHGCTTQYAYQDKAKIISIANTHNLCLKDGILYHQRDYHSTAYPPYSPGPYYPSHGFVFQQPTNLRLYATLANGTELQVHSGTFLKE